MENFSRISRISEERQIFLPASSRDIPFPRFPEASRLGGRKIVLDSILPPVAEPTGTKLCVQPATRLIGGAPINAKRGGERVWLVDSRKCVSATLAIARPRFSVGKVSRILETG
ncbi:hypothetical protein KM043_010196 [Ampulex compressa]|nr:hypothetical protein KM043_010196 [Ampulex compressa]